MDWLLARQPGIERQLAAAGRVGELGRELSRWLGTGALPPEAEEPLRSPGGLSGLQAAAIAAIRSVTPDCARRQGPGDRHHRDAARGRRAVGGCL